MTLARVELESFEDTTASEPEESADFKLGFEAGQAEAEASEAAALARATEAVAATLADMAFGYTEARVLLLDRIRPLLAQVAEVILPQVAQESFSAHLLDTILANFDTMTGVPIEISISPTAIDHVRTILSDASNCFVFVADAALEDGQAVLKNADTQIMIDLPALTLGLQTALNGLEPLNKEAL